MARLLFRIGAAAHRRPALFILAWLVVLIGAGVGAGQLSGSTTNTFSLPGQESTEAMDLIKREFGGGGGDTASARVVVKAPAGQALTAEANTAAVADLVARLNGLDGVASATNPLQPTPTTLSPDLTTAFSTVTYDVGVADLTGAQRDALTDAVADARTGGLAVEVTGTATLAGGGGHGAEAIGVLAALVVLAITYGALAIAGMNLLTALIGVGVGICGVQIATGFVDLTASTPVLASMLGLAVGIDYALFIVSRFRHELRRGQDVGTAVATATGTAGAAVVTAGLTVVIALVGLFVTGIPFLTQMGVAAAFTVVIAVLIATTLVPAVLALLGRRALPRRERAAQAATAHRERGFFRGWIDGVVRRRWVALLVSTAALGALSIPLFSLQTTLAATPAEGTTQARAAHLLADAFGPGFDGPLTVFFDGADAPRAAAGAKAVIAGLPDVAAVADPVPNADGTAALLTVVPGSGPASEATEHLVGEIRQRLLDRDGPRAYVTGQTAVSVDVAKTVNDALPIYLLLVVGLAFVLLVLVFRSLLVPLVGVLGFLLTIGASLGSAVAIFQWGWLSDLFGVDRTGPLISLTPILAVGILFGLAMDYQVFLVSRMHEAHEHGEPDANAIRTGFRQAAPVVVAAAVIMFSVFAGFFPGADATLMSIAFALASGILFDAFVVRMVLVPAAMAMLGERAWWLPRWLRWLPRLDVEGAGLRQASEQDDRPPVRVG